MRKVIALGAGLLGLLSLVSCGQDTSPAVLQVRLVDAPGDYEAVNVDIVDVQVNVGDDEAGWQSLDEANPGIYDLLELTNGVDALLGEIELTEGSLSQVRLILGEDNTLVQDGQTIPLNVPSGAQTGLKVNVNASLAAGATYQLVLDFDVAKSVVPRGNSGNYNLKPVIRGIMDPLTGSIAGTIDPADVNTAIIALVGADTITSTFTDDTGGFLLRALPAGTYTVVAQPHSESGLQDNILTGITVTDGVSNDVGVVILK